MASFMDRKKKKKKQSYKVDYSSPFKKKHKTAGEKYIDRLESMLDSSGSILMPRTRPPQGDAPPPPPPKPNPVVEDPFAVTPTPAEPQPEPTSAYIFEENKADDQAQNPPIPETENMSTPPPSASGSTFQEGAILQWEGPTLGLYKQHDPNKGYDLVYILSPTGKLIPRGVALHGYQAEQIGFLPLNLMTDFEKNMTWQRDVLVFHLFDYTYSTWVPVIKATGQDPQPCEPTVYPKGGAVQEPVKSEAPPPPVESAPPPQSHTPAPPKPKPKPAKPSLQRGAKFSINIGNHKWEAVYWGKDLQGTVVAHQVDDEWKLMHLDLEKFKDSMIHKGELPKKELNELERQIRRSSATQY